MSSRELIPGYSLEFERLSSSPQAEEHSYIKGRTLLPAYFKFKVKNVIT